MVKRRAALFSGSRWPRQTKARCQKFIKFIARKRSFHFAGSNFTPSVPAALIRATLRSRRSFIFQLARTRALLPWLPMIRSHIAWMASRSQLIGPPLCLSLLSPTTHSERSILDSLVTDPCLTQSTRFPPKIRERENSKFEQVRDGYYYFTDSKVSGSCL